MSFAPLPPIFLDDLRGCAAGPLVELGCGDGVFTAELRAHGASPLCLDRLPPRAGTVAAVVAEAADLPFRDGSVSLLVAANLLRHLGPRPRGEAVPPAWRRCLAPGGRLWIFEDEPVSRPAAARHYRDAARLLARIQPWGRGPLLPNRDFVAHLGAEARSRQWQSGEAVNTTSAREPEALVRLLLGSAGAAGGEAGRLAEAIGRDGLSYGKYWWARWACPGRV